MNSWVYAIKWSEDRLGNSLKILIGQVTGTLNPKWVRTSTLVLKRCLENYYKNILSLSIF